MMVAGRKNGFANLPPVNVSSSVAAQLKNARSMPICLRLKPVSRVWFAEIGSSVPDASCSPTPNLLGHVGGHAEAGADTMPVALGFSVLVDRLVAVAKIAREPQRGRRRRGDARLGGRCRRSRRSRCGRRRRNCGRPLLEAFEASRERRDFGANGGDLGAGRALTGQARGESKETAKTAATRLFRIDFAPVLRLMN